MNIAIRSALMRASHDLHGVFDVAPLSGFFGVALVLASFGIVGPLGDGVKAVLLDHLPRDRVDLYLSELEVPIHPAARKFYASPAVYEILFDEWRNNAAANWTQFTDCMRTMPWRGQQWDFNAG